MTDAGQDHWGTQLGVFAATTPPPKLGLLHEGSSEGLGSLLLVPFTTWQPTTRYTSPLCSIDCDQLTADSSIDQLNVQVDCDCQEGERHYHLLRPLLLLSLLLVWLPTARVTTVFHGHCCCCCHYCWYFVCWVYCQCLTSLLLFLNICLACHTPLFS